MVGRVRNNVVELISQMIYIHTNTRSSLKIWRRCATIYYGGASSSNGLYSILTIIIIIIIIINSIITTVNVSTCVPKIDMISKL